MKSYKKRLKASQRKVFGGLYATTRKADAVQARRKIGNILRKNVPRVSQGLERDIENIKGSGQALPSSERAFFEPRLGVDLGNVHLHNDARAARLARSIDARAFTLGRDVVVGAGSYSPSTRSGRQLMAHELTHVLQQGGLSGAASNGSVRRQTIQRTPQADQAAKHAEDMKNQTDPGIWFDDWAQDNRDNNNNGKVDDKDKAENRWMGKDGRHYRGNPWPAFTCDRHPQVNVPENKKKWFWVHYLVCIDIPRIAYRKAGLPFPWQGRKEWRSVSTTMKLLATRYRRYWKILRKNGKNRSSFNGQVRRGDFLGYAGHSGVAVSNTKMVELPGPSSGYQDANIKNDMEKSSHRNPPFIARPRAKAARSQARIINDAALIQYAHSRSLASRGRKLIRALARLGKWNRNRSAYSRRQVRRYTSRLLRKSSPSSRHIKNYKKNVNTQLRYLSRGFTSSLQTLTLVKHTARYCKKISVSMAALASSSGLRSRKLKRKLRRMSIYLSRLAQKLNTGLVKQWGPVIRGTNYTRDWLRNELGRLSVPLRSLLSSLIAYVSRLSGLARDITQLRFK